MKERLMALRSTQRTLDEKNAQIQENIRRAIEGDTPEVVAERRALLNHLAGEANSDSEMEEEYYDVDTHRAITPPPDNE